MRDELKHGLDDVKIHVEKMRLGTFSLSAVIEEMRKEYVGKLTIPEAGNYQEKHPPQAENTLWLMSDNSVNPRDVSKPGNKRYYICYDQRYYNDNPFLIFDENKPGWISHTTIPHTLLAAMLNVTKPWSHGKRLDVVDPFAGTGTTLLELAKEDEVRVRLGDQNPLVDCVIRDNAQFFSLDVKEITELAEYIRSLLNELPDSGEDIVDALSPELFPGPVAALVWAAASSKNKQTGIRTSKTRTFLQLTSRDLPRRISSIALCSTWP